jgi:Domain of unknown function (DUF4404)
MSKQTLRSSLEKLHAELGAGAKLDPELRTMLTHVAQDIERVLADETPHAASLPAQVENIAVKFEADHPQLAHTLNEITDALSKIGV